MALYYGTYSCGHGGSVNIIGPTKDREWKKEKHFSGLCPECYKKMIEEERAAENAASEKAAKEMELPELSGSPKQCAWANTIRVKLINQISSEIEKIRESGRKHTKIDVDSNLVSVDLSEMEDIEDMLLQKSDARYWIDRRAWKPDFLLEEAYKELQKKKNEIPEEIREELLKEEAALTVEPQGKEKDGIVKISVENSCIVARYKKDDTFRQIVKSLGYTWGEAWSKNITEYTGPEKDRIAEIGNKLLSNGFTVQFPDEESRDMAVSGKFTPECSRWVKYNKEKEKLAIAWKGHDDDLYQKARRLSGAKWDSGSMLVPVEYYLEVIDFAETMGFQISKRAHEEIEAFRKKSDEFLKKNVKESSHKKNDGKDELRRQLEKSGVIEDLKDET